MTRKKKKQRRHQQNQQQKQEKNEATTRQILFEFNVKKNIGMKLFTAPHQTGIILFPRATKQNK